MESPAADLREVGLRLARDLLLGPVLPLRRLLLRESGRFPELAEEYFRRAPEAVLTALTTVMAELGARGLLVVDDPRTAADHYAYLILGADLDRALFLGTDATAADVETRAAAGVEVFLRAYLPR